MTSGRIDAEKRRLNCARGELALLALLTLTYFTTNADSQTIAPLLPAIRAAFPDAEARVTWLIAFYGAAAAVNSLTIGIFIDRHGSRRLLPLGYVLFAVGETVSALSGSFPLLCVGRMITAIGSSTLSLAMMIRISDVFGEHRRSEAFGIFVAGGAAAAVIGLPTAAWLAETRGWQSPFIGLLGLSVLSGMGLAGLALSGRSPLGEVRPEPKETQGAQTTQEAQARDGCESPKQLLLPMLMKDRQLARVLSLGMLFNIGVYALLAPLGLWCHDRFGLGTARVFAYYIVGGVGGVLMAPIAGRIAGKFGALKALMVATIALAIELPFVPFSPNAAALFPLFFLAAGFDVLRLVPYHVLSLQVASTHHRARFLGMRNAISQSGIFLGAAIGGFIYGQTRFGFAAAGIFASATCLFTLPILLKIRRAETARKL